MNVYPALDLIGGRVVRLYRGDYAAVTEYSAAPAAWATRYTTHGAAALHLVDLEAARDGMARQWAEIGQIVDLARAAKVPVQCGGGVRCTGDIERRLDAGCARVVVGSVAVRDPDMLIAALARFGPDRLVAALDVRAEGADYRPALDGWTAAGGETLWPVVERLAAAGLEHLLCTAIDRDGSLAGPRLDLYRELVRRYPGLAIQASGGIATLDNLKALRDTGVAAAVVGKALLDGVFTLADAKRAAA